MRGKRRRQVGVRRRPAHDDPVADIEPRGLPRVLDQPDDLAGVPLRAQRVGHGQVERDGLAASGRHAPALERRLRHDEVGGGQRHGPTDGTSTVTDPPGAATACARTAGSAARITAATAWVASPNRRPRARNSGLTV